MSGRALALYAALYIVFLYAPVALLPIFAFNDSTIIAFPLSGFTLGWFAELAATPALRAAALTSLFIATATAVVSTGLGLCAARASAYHAFPGKRGVLGFIMLPLVLPEVIVGVSLLVVIVNLLGFSLSSWTVILGHVLIATPFAIAVLGSAFGGIDPALEEAAMDLGETRWSAFRRVTLPLIMPGIVSSLLLTFIISLDEFIIAFFLTGRDPTLPVYIWGQLRFPQKLPAIMALGTILVALSLVLLTAAEVLRRRGAAKAGMEPGRGLA